LCLFDAFARALRPGLRRGRRRRRKDGRRDEDDSCLPSDGAVEADEAPRIKPD
jgi:hypothetical protein